MVDVGCDQNVPVRMFTKHIRYVGLIILTTAAGRAIILAKGLRAPVEP
jgi:hypothetical protein